MKIAYPAIHFVISPELFLFFYIRGEKERKKEGRKEERKERKKERKEGKKEEEKKRKKLVNNL